jgi:PhoH-like ATPase
MSQIKKYLVLDTSVLLYDKDSIYNFGENDIFIPLIVLEELDKFKDKPGVLGENARHVNRMLDNLRDKGTLSEGVAFKEDSIAKIKVVTKIETLDSIDTFGRYSNDNIILATALHVRDKIQEANEVKVITKDINLRVKCDALGIKAEDYYADHKFIKEDKGLYKGFSEIIVDSGTISQLYGNKSALLNQDIIEENELNENQFLVLKSETNQSALCILKNGEAILLPTKDEIYKKTKIMPKNKEQIFSLYLLCYCDIPLISMTGVPGSGKTYLALMTALKFLESKSHNRIIFTRPIQTVGKDMGFLPGDMNEKMAPWLAPIVDNFRNEFGDLSYFEMLMDKGQIDVAPLAYIRGRSFNDAIIIVDEAQNATIHELKTVITRTGKNSKIILIGDTDQIDLQYVDKISNGLTIVVEKMKNQTVSGHVNFEKGYRSDLANAAAKLL